MWHHTVRVQLRDFPLDTSKAQKALNDARHSLDRVRRDKQNSDQALARLFDPEWYGAEGEWKKLDGTCIEKEVGEYVSSHSFRCEVC